MQHCTCLNPVDGATMVSLVGDLVAQPTEALETPFQNTVAVLHSHLNFGQMVEKLVVAIKRCWFFVGSDHGWRSCVTAICKQVFSIREKFSGMLSC